MCVFVYVYLSVLMMGEREGFRHHNNGHHRSSPSYVLFVSLREQLKLHNASLPLLLEADESLNLSPPWLQCIIIVTSHNPFHKHIAKNLIFFKSILQESTISIL